MCGIVGYSGPKKSFPILIEMLKKLEYRGYDSAGVAVLNENVIVEKCVGTIDRLSISNIEGNVGIGHTRWATHGTVCEENAHPHTDCNNEIAVVHNGIIENFTELRKELQEKGHKLKSETDTEVVAHLVEDYLKETDSLKEAVEKTMKRLEGNYALGVVKKGENKIIATRKGSPLVIGVGEGENFIASDIPSFLEHTKKVIYLHDGDLVELNKNEIKIFNNEQQVERKIDEIAWSAEQVQKGNFKHFMMKEICEQAEVIKRAVAQNSESIQRIANEIVDAKQVFFLACGTASYSCHSASYAFARGGKRFIPVIIGSEFNTYSQVIGPGTLIIAVSQSGETADVIEGIKKAKKKGAKIVSITNTMGSTVQREADDYLLMNAQAEIAVASTKAYTAMLTVLYLLAYASWGDLEGGKRRLENLYNLVYNLTSESTRTHIQKLAEKLTYARDMYIIGRDLQFPTAMEVALKIKETTYIHAEPFAGGELKHGTLALIEKGTPVIALFSEENMKETLNNVMEIKARGGYIIGVGSKNDDAFDFFIKTPECKALNPVVQHIPMQILAYELSVLRGNNPDKPRNLAKSVTVK